MGANATTSVPSYVAGEVLTAADLNITNSGIPVFADSTARTNGFGGTGEKTLAEGQYAYLESDDKTYVYDGAAWKEVGTSALIPINTTSFSSVTSVSLDSVFTSTYQNYRIVMTTDDPATAQTFTLRFRTSASDNTTSNYARMNSSNTAGGGAETVTGTTTSFFAGYVGAGSLFFSDLTVFRPQQTANTAIAGFTISNNSTYTSISRWNIGGWFNATTSFDGFSLLMGANTTGVVRVYAYANS
jgi:hypothetical protein